MMAAMEMGVEGMGVVERVGVGVGVGMEMGVGVKEMEVGVKEMEVGEMEEGRVEPGRWWVGVEEEGMG